MSTTAGSPGASTAGTTAGTTSGTSGTTPAASTSTGTAQTNTGTAQTNTGQSATASDWTAGLSEEYRGYAQTKGFKDPGAVVESYRNLEKLLGAPKDRLLKLPEKDDDASWGEVYDKLGRPKDSKDYGLQGPLGDWAKDAFHKAGISKKAAEGLAKQWDEFNTAKSAETTKAYEAIMAKEENALKKEWGMAYEQHVGVAKKAAQVFGIDGDTIDNLEVAMGHDKLMKFLHQVGSRLGEDSFVGQQNGRGGFGAMTPDAARSRIDALRQDNEFVRRYTAGDMSARDEMERLHKFAYPES